MYYERENNQDYELEADSTHSAPIQGSDSGRAQGEAAGENTSKAKSEES
jgi:hypothetical protein